MKIIDLTLIMGLVLSPAWVPQLNAINEIFTSLSLFIGILLALTRIVKHRRPPDDQTDDQMGESAKRTQDKDPFD